MEIELFRRDDLMFGYAIIYLLKGLPWESLRA
jgi:hypothetical protein